MRRVLSFIFGWCFIIVCVVFSIKSTALNPDFYIPKYEEMDLASDIGVSKKDLNQSIRLLLEYLDDKRADIKGQSHGMVYLKKLLMKKKRVIWWM